MFRFVKKLSAHCQIIDKTSVSSEFFRTAVRNRAFTVCAIINVARRGLYSTAALYIADCALAPNVFPSFISRGATTPSGAGALY
jgi:hypothetical protein